MRKEGREEASWLDLFVDVLDAFDPSKQRSCVWTRASLRPSDKSSKPTHPLSCLGLLFEGGLEDKRQQDRKRRKKRKMT